MTSAQYIELLAPGILETLYMTLISSLFAYIIGLPLGIMLVVMDKDGIRPVVPVHKVLGIVINLLRSIPFLILMIAIIPLTRFIVGTSVGSVATLVPLVVAAAPYIARLVEGSIREVDRGVIEAAQSMGASPMRIITKVMLPEARPSLLVGCAIAVTTILSYSAMSGIVGGGGLGAIAINYGYYRKNVPIMIATIILLVIVVQILQELGMLIARTLDKRK